MTTALLPIRPRKAIGLTALIDVVFILLMFFMLTSSFSQLRSVSLTSASAVATQSNTVPALVVVAAGGHFYLDARRGDVLTPQQLRMQIPPEQQAVLLPQASTSVQVLVEAMEQLTAAGFESLILGASIPDAPDSW